MGFWELTVPAPPDTSEGLTNFLWEHGALGVVEEASAAGPARLRAFFPDIASSGELLAAVTRYQDALAALGFAVPEAPATVEPLPDEPWGSAWQRAFPPREVGERLIVVPPWAEAHAAQASARLPVLIYPGRAFGTGQHGSTEGCLALLERAVAGAVAEAALDIGTGTGILAIAAARLGVPRILAIDVDPDAVRSAGDNAALNGQTGHVHVRPGRPEDLPAEAAFGLVLANLVTASHLALADRYRRLVTVGGALVLGGMLAGEERQVIDALGAQGFGLEAALSVQGWVSTLMRREP